MKRRQFITAGRNILLFALLWQLLTFSQRAQAQVRAVDAPGFTVADADRSIAFFQRVLSFEKVSDTEVTGNEYEHLQGVFGVRMRLVRMRLGDEFIELTEYLAPQGKPIPPDVRSNDRSFQHIAIIVSDMNKAYQWLRQNKVTHASPAPQRLPDWNQNAGGIQAFYFKDPDGHALEILQFPAGKGAPKWQTLAQQAAGKLFLGIDHTAIVVSDTDKSLAFYRDQLGFKVVGGAHNYGPEQEHLNQVFGARLRITALKAERGPGIEFLEYIAPPGGRDLPADAKAIDLVFWNTQLTVADLPTLTGALRVAGTTFVSKPADGATAQIVRDPDGHALSLLSLPQPAITAAGR